MGIVGEGDEVELVGSAGGNGGGEEYLAVGKDRRGPATAGDGGFPGDIGCGIPGQRNGAHLGDAIAGRSTELGPGVGRRMEAGCDGVSEGEEGGGMEASGAAERRHHWWDAKAR